MSSYSQQKNKLMSCSKWALDRCILLSVEINVCVCVCLPIITLCATKKNAYPIPASDLMLLSMLFFLPRELKNWTIHPMIPLIKSIHSLCPLSLTIKCFVPAAMWDWQSLPAIQADLCLSLPPSVPLSVNLRLHFSFFPACDWHIFFLFCFFWELDKCAWRTRGIPHLTLRLCTEGGY